MTRIAEQLKRFKVSNLILCSGIGHVFPLPEGDLSDFRVDFDFSGPVRFCDRQTRCRLRFAISLTIPDDC